MQHGGGVARAHPESDGPVAAGHRIPERADLQVDLHGDAAIEVNIGLNLQLQANVQILNGVSDYGRGRARRHHRRNHRNAVAYQYLGLLAVAHPDARIGQQVGRSHIVLDVECSRKLTLDEAIRIELKLLGKAQAKFAQA